jgi:hemolysin
MDVVASRVIAGGRLSASAGDELLIDGRADRSELTETVRHRKHLWRGDSDRHEVTESAVGSQLRGGEVALHSDTRVHVRGSQVQWPEHHRQGRDSGRLGAPGRRG